jgi:hypothetical protein
MANEATIQVPCDPDQDDCLQAAQEAYLEDHPELAGWDLNPQWGNEDRSTVALTIPTWHLVEWYKLHDADNRVVQPQDQDQDNQDYTQAIVESLECSQPEGWVMSDRYGRVYAA